jgi:uncharacterized membrane protein YdjX (TVP38/TMEM64 family)
MINLSNKEVQASLIKLLLVATALITLSAILWKPLVGLVSNAEEFRSFVQGFGIWAPLIYIAIGIVQVLISPIPGQILGIFSGYTFGWFYGTIYGMTGIIIGSFIAFMLSRKFGRPFVEKVVDKNILKKFDHLSEDRGKATLFLIYLLPFMPDDIICFIAGLTNMRIRTLVLIAFLGRLPGTLVLNLVGAGFSAQVAMTWWMWVIVALIVLIIAFIFFNRERVEEEMMKLVEKTRNKN